MTGGTRGIGLAISKELARRGYAVTTCGSSLESVSACRDDVTAAGLDITVVQIDVCDAPALAQGIGKCGRAHGGLDALICCAGRPVLGDASTLELEDWDRCLDLNLRAFFTATKAALPHMIVRGEGAIVFVSSIWAQTATADRVAYTTAKTALTGLARALAVDHAKNGIRVNCVAPGYVETDLLRASAKRSGVDMDDRLRQIAAAHPLGRLIAPEDIAKAAVFLADEDARNITGQTLVVDGGVTVRFALPEG